MKQGWRATPSRKYDTDQYIDVMGFGRFRIKPERRGTAPNARTVYVLYQNNERIGGDYPTPEDAKAAVERITEPFKEAVRSL